MPAISDPGDLKWPNNTSLSDPDDFKMTVLSDLGLSGDLQRKQTLSLFTKQNQQYTI